MAPALVRRVYGVLCTAGPECRITRYMAGVAACVAAFTVWMMAGPPTEIAFLVPALLAVPAWLGVRRAVVLPDEPPKTRALRPSKGYIVLLAATVAALLAFDLLNGAIHTNIVLTGMEESAPLMVLGFTLPLVGFVAYGLLHDKGHERLGFICGMGLCLIGVIAALIPSGTAEGRLWVLAFTDGLGGTYTEFFILTIPVFFFTGAKRPLFAASLGVIVNLVASAYRWAGEAWLPERLLAPDAPLYAATAITAVVFVALAHFIFERRREKSLAAALHALVYGGADEPPGMEGAGLTPEEREVALLLIAGKTRSDILRKLRIPAAQVSQREDAIRQKLKLPRSPDPAIAAAAELYKLTKRETDVLAYLRQGMGNGEIAAELSLSEETVKGHVRNLMRKLPVESRGGVGAWLESWARDGENP
jgi:DNA-binding CsgD family transcriptional regulator